MQSPPGLWFLNAYAEIQLAAADNPAGLSVILLQEAHGNAPPLHVHHDEDEIFHIIEGELRFRVGDDTSVAKAGETVLGPRGIPHGLRVISDGARVIVITTGGCFEGLVRAMGRPALRRAAPDFAAPSPETLARLRSEAALRRIDILGPQID